MNVVWNCGGIGVNGGEWVLIVGNGGEWLGIARNGTQCLRIRNHESNLNFDGFVCLFFF